jgi:alpha-beta hydrolase superfamily lysophospholipase
MARPRRLEPPPAPEGFPRDVVTSSSDADLALHHRAAMGIARGVVCILHDLAEHAGRYVATAKVLSGAGFHVYAHDHRGHGATRAFDAPPGELAARGGFEKVVEDAVFVSQRARAAHRGLSVITFGQGFGGLVALRQVQLRPDTVDGAAIWNADVDGAGVKVIKRALSLVGMFGGGRGRTLYAGLLKRYGRRFKPKRTDYDWLSRDPAAVDAYIADPLCGQTPEASTWRDVLAGIEQVSVDAAFGAAPRGTPFHLLAGSDDPSTDNGQSIARLDLRLRDLGFTDVSRVILGGGRHDTLHDEGREEALRMLLRWMERVAADQPPFQ